jgi:Fic-DOC domain mobile mystery protein B
VTNPFDEPADATALTPDEQRGLKPTWITTRADLNLAEQENVDRAVAWTLVTRPADVLDGAFVRELHRRMFGDVWTWAGRYRTVGTNLGIEPHGIPSAVAHALLDAAFWRDHEVFARDEIAVRLHHRLVWIHPFPNGNGRHARLLADLLVAAAGGRPFTWGGASKVNAGDARRRYLAALRTADHGPDDVADLLAFARS